MTTLPSAARPVLPAYMAAAVALMLALVTAMAPAADWSPAGEAAFWVLAAFVILGELFPIRLPRRDTLDEVTLSTPFAFALLLMAGPVPAIAVYAAASVLEDALDGRSPLKLAFNAAQYALSVLAAYAVLAALGSPPPHPDLLGSHLPELLAAALAMFLVNQVLVGIAAAGALGVPVLKLLRSDLPFQLWTAGFLLTLGPIVLAAQERNAALIPLLFFPMLAIYVGGRQAVLNQHRALHDELTDLPNRRLFNDRLAQAIGSFDREGSVAALILDLDDFKAVNDTLGHQHGDELIAAVGGRLRDALPADLTLARLGGDEFAILAPDVRGPAAAGEVAQAAFAAFREPFSVGGLSLPVEVTIGVALHPQHGETPEILLRHADVALYAAKAEHTGCEVYNPEDDAHSLDRLALAGQLRRGIERGELVLHYQPKLALRADRPLGVEALVRWQHPQLGLIGPDGFVALAERSDLIRRLTECVLDLALAQCRRWHDEGLGVRVSVNVSARSLLDRELPRQIRALLAEHGLDGASLQIEITEHSLVADLPRARSTLTAIRAMGVGVAIDDFGTGYSSLAQLTRLPIDEIKIDKSFVLGMEANGDDAAIVRSTIELGRNLSLEVTAEGVETAVVYEELVALGCDFAQGFYIGRPMPAADCARDLRRAIAPDTVPVAPAPLVRLPKVRSHG